MTSGLRRAGVAPGSRVASILTNTPLAVRGIAATWLAGGTLGSFPVPSRGMDLEEYGEHLRGLVTLFEPDAMFVDSSLLTLLPEDVQNRANARSWESVAGRGSIPFSPPALDDVAFVQFSSGSTSLPKGCMLTARAIEAQVELILTMVDARRGADCDVSWLPLSHDMGLFGNLLPSWLGDLEFVLSTPERFTMSPRTWFDDVADFGAALTCGTDTALQVATRRHTHQLRRPLRLRTVILGAERIHWETLTRAVEGFGADGLTSEALMPAYGMAEATLAVTSTPAREAPRHVVVDGVSLADGAVEDVAADHPASTRIVACGRPCPGVEVPGLRREELAELRVRSVSLAGGYLGDEASTNERFRDGTFYTGDLGFQRDGYVYPVGRMDDVIPIGGRNVYAREIEAAVDDLSMIRSGCSTLIQRGEGQAQRLVLLTEIKDGCSDFRGLARQAAALAMRKAGVALDECVFLEKGLLPKTPSGKIQRYRCRQGLDDGRLSLIARVEFKSE